MNILKEAIGQDNVGKACSTAAANNEKLKRDIVQCKECNRTEKVNPVKCSRDGRPKCCSYTMSLDVE